VPAGGLVGNDAAHPGDATRAEAGHHVLTLSPDEAKDPEVDEPLLGGRYRLIERVGSGGVAVVYRARDERLGREVAVKRLHADGPADAARRFLREAQIGAALSHPNLITVYDAFADGESLVVVMELIDGPDLGEALGDDGMEAGRLERVLSDVAAALDHVHAAGIVHRDVKPSNVLLAPDGGARLTDLGIARVLEDTGTTQSGLFVGSAPYMSPEQLTHGEIGPSVDVYALATTAYEALSGKPPRAGLPAAIAYQATEADPPDVREVRPGTPAAAAEVLQRGMAREPDRRPASAGAFVAELRAALGEAPEAASLFEPTTEAQPPYEPTTEALPAPLPAPPRPAAPTVAPRPSPAPVAPPPSRGRLFAGALLLAVAAIAAVVIISSGNTEDPPATDAADQSPAAEPERAGGNGGEGSGATAAAPEQSVEDFYELVADADYEAAAALLTPTALDQLGGVESFPANFDTLETVEFPTLETISESSGNAEVELVSVATHSDRVDDCAGTVTTVVEGDGWLIDNFGVDCG